MKKLYTLLIFIAILLVFAGCEHTHTPVIDPAIEATCTENGLTEGTHCSGCGESIFAQKLIQSKGHTVIVDKAVNATCLTAGLTEGSHCSVCGEILSAQMVIPTTGHNIMVFDETAPTCAAEGHTAGKECIICGEIFSGREIIAKLEHTPVTLRALAPSCTAEGLTRGQGCFVCGEVIVKQEPVAKREHTVVTTAALEPTCAADGLTEGQHCSVCDEIIVAQEPIPKLEHVPVTEPATDPTCEEDGYAEGTRCDNCGIYLTEVTVYPALGHTEVVDRAIAATYSTPGLTEGKHCSVCGKILVAQQAIPMLEKLTDSLPVGIITESTTTFTTNHLELQIDPGVYIPGNLEQTLNTVTKAMETVSGMKFEGNPIYAETAKQYSPQSTTDLMLVEVKKADAESEFQGTGAWLGGANTSSGDIINLSALIHECSHVLQYRQSNWNYCGWAMDGVSTYTTYKTQKYIEENYPNLTESVGLSCKSLLDMRVNNYSKLYEHPMEYWIDNTFEYAPSANAAIGFRLMWYLDVTFGNYTSWIYKLEESYPFHENGIANENLTNDKIIEAFCMTYGESVFDDFYAWLKDNESVFEAGSHTLNLRGADKFNIYPTFNDSGNYYKPTILSSGSEYEILYRDLYIGIGAGNQYLTEYKGKTYDNPVLLLNDGVKVKLFDSHGNLMRVDSGESIDIIGVSFIQLVGEGTLTKFEIVGYN